MKPVTGVPCQKEKHLSWKAGESVPTLKPASLTCSPWLDRRLVSAAYTVATD